jgi:hypothetical protein
MRIEHTQSRYGSELILPIGRAQRVVLCVCGGATGGALSAREGTKLRSIVWSSL